MAWGGGGGGGGQLVGRRLVQQGEPGSYLMSHFPKFCITADEDPQIESFCITLKLMLHLKLINFHCLLYIFVKHLHPPLSLAWVKQ